MVVGELERLVDSLLDRDRRHHDHELGETVALVQLEDRAQVDVGLPGPRLHLDGEVAGLQGPRLRQAVVKLSVPQILENLVIDQGQAVADAQARLMERQVSRVPGDRELGSTHFLTAEQATDRLHCLKLEVEVGLETELHGRRRPLSLRCGLSTTRRSGARITRTHTPASGWSVSGSGVRV